MEKNTTLNKSDIVETTHFVSKDGKWFVTKTTITSIKSMNYIAKVMEPKVVEA
jgi:hypothetical protein